jgi:DNA-binding transcriptional MerR regulator
LVRLHTIKRLKNFGFTLNEVSDLLEMIEMNEASCKNVSHKILEKISLIDEKIRELIAVKGMLLNGVKKCQDGGSPQQPEDNCPILVFDKFTT